MVLVNVPERAYDTTVFGYLENIGGNIVRVSFELWKF